MVQQKEATIRLTPQDNVVVARIDLEPGMIIPEESVVCRDYIPTGHKLAVGNIEIGAPVRKYNQIIGFSCQHISVGEHVHTHNLELKDFSREYEIGTATVSTKHFPEDQQATFKGIVRTDGRVATRNFIGILPTVGCANSVSRFIADTFHGEGLAEFSNVDGVVSLAHGSGCCLVPGGKGIELLQRTLAGYARHPNFAGVLLVGLGCEANHMGNLLDNMNLTTGPFLRAINIQDAGGTKETVHRGCEVVREMLFMANQIHREPVSASHLVLGVECGGSDAFSGITANPALGVAADILVRHGGTVILSETPEIYGAEHLLVQRAITPKVGEKLLEYVRWWMEYTTGLGGEIDNNPTPGNKAGGLTTVIEKSLGAVAKGGTTNLVQVYGFAESVTKKGLVFMDTPGHDLISLTGLIAGGAKIICFTTGRGTVCGCKPVPTIKLASNSQMYHRLNDDMDMNCGLILDSEASIEEMGKAIFQLIIDTASGNKTKSELLGFGDYEFMPWHIGPVL